MKRPRMKYGKGTDKVKTVALLCLNMAALSSDLFFVAFTMLWAYPQSKNEVIPLEVSLN